MVYTVGNSWRGLRGCRLGAAMMTIVWIVGHNLVGEIGRASCRERV